MASWDATTTTRPHWACDPPRGPVPLGQPLDGLLDPSGEVGNGLDAPDYTQPPCFPVGGAEGATSTLGPLVSSAGAWRWTQGCGVGCGSCMQLEVGIAGHRKGAGTMAAAIGLGLELRPGPVCARA